eukprot:Ihof_evm6s42 gene=Ihof_evmTU6s42
MAGETVKIVVNQEVLCSFKPSRCFKDFQQPINSACFSDDGTLLAVASDDDTIRTYDCNEGRDKQKVKTKKYGGDLVHFAHHNSTVLHASTKLDHAVRYLSLHDNMYMRYFTAHKGKVVCLKVNPVDDKFLSTSTDGTLRLWNINSTSCLGRLCLTEGRKLVAAWDNFGVIFALGIDSKTIKIYDTENFVVGPFATFENLIDHTRPSYEWVDMQFSTDGKALLISTDGPELLIVDAFKDNVLHRLTGHKNDSRKRLIGCFSPDSKFVLCGSEDGKVHIWDVQTGAHLQELSSGLTTPITLIRFNPRMTLFVSVSEDKL